MKTSKDLTSVGTLRTAKLQLFLMSILILVACDNDEIKPVFVDSQINRVEAPLENTTGETERRWWRAPTSFKVFCDWLRARADQLFDEAKDPTLSDKRRREILTELREIGSAWKAGGCQAVYGDIVKILPRQPLNTGEAAPSGGTVLN